MYHAGGLARTIDVFTGAPVGAFLMEARRPDGEIIVGGDARVRFYESSGVGRPRSGDLVLSWEEAAYLLERGDLDSVDGAGYQLFLSEPPDALAIERYLVYRDLRERGYYVATTPSSGASSPTKVDLLVRPRGAEPTGDAVEYQVSVVTDSTTVALGELTPRTMAVVDDEAEITYLSISSFVPAGEWDDIDGWDLYGSVGGMWVLLEDPPDALYEDGFFGRPLGEELVLLNHLETRYLTTQGRLTLDDGSRLGADAGGDQPNRAREMVYDALREAGCVPRSGLKFGSDFRVYTDLESASDPGHSAFLVTVATSGTTRSMQSLSQAVRLANGVRKTQVFAIVDDDIDWLALERLTP